VCKRDFMRFCAFRVEDMGNMDQVRQQRHSPPRHLYSSRRALLVAATSSPA